MSSSPDLSRVLPRVLIVSRRTVRKNKFVDFVGEFSSPIAAGITETERFHSFSLVALSDSHHGFRRTVLAWN